MPRGVFTRDKGAALGGGGDALGGGMEDGAGAHET